MTRRTSTLLILTVLAASALMVALGGARLRGASASLEGARSLHERVARDCRRVLELRSRTQTVAAGEQPSQDVFQRVNATLKTAGLSRVRTQNVSPAGDRALADEPGRREQSVRVELAPVTLDELGGFLARWCAEQALWTVTEIELTADGRGDYRVSLRAVARYVAENPQALALEGGGS